MKSSSKGFKGCTQVYNIPKKKSQVVPSNYSILFEAQNDFTKTAEESSITMLCMVVDGKVYFFLYSNLYIL